MGTPRISVAGLDRTAGGPSRPVTLLPVEGLPEITRGDDLAAEIVARGELVDGDVVVVAQKIISKAEGALVAVPAGEDPDTFRRRLARDTARRIVADVPWVTIVETQHGLVCANGGLDASNAPDGHLVALPEDPDASARHLREQLRTRFGVDVSVVITDTFGRPWRTGQTEVAIGASGIDVLRQETQDSGGRDLTVTEPAIADAVAAATDLARGKADGVPVVVVRGAIVDRSDTSTAADLRRTGPTDLFARGAGQLALLLTEDEQREPSAPAAAWQTERIRTAVEGVATRGSHEPRGGPSVAVEVRDDGATVIDINAPDEFLAGMAAMAAIAAAKDLGLAACLVDRAATDKTAAKVRIGTPD